MTIWHFVVLLVVGSTAMWTYFDATKLRDLHLLGVGPGDQPPHRWAAWVALLMPVGLALYLRVRAEAQLEPLRSGRPQRFRDYGWSQFTLWATLGGIAVGVALWLTGLGDWLGVAVAIVAVGFWGGRLSRAAGEVETFDVPSAAAVEPIGFRPSQKSVLIEEPEVDDGVLDPTQFDGVFAPLTPTSPSRVPPPSVVRQPPPTPVAPVPAAPLPPAAAAPAAVPPAAAPGTTVAPVPEFPTQTARVVSSSEAPLLDQRRSAPPTVRQAQASGASASARPGTAAYGGYAARARSPMVAWLWVIAVIVAGAAAAYALGLFDEPSPVPADDVKAASTSAASIDPIDAIDLDAELAELKGEMAVADDEMDASAPSVALPAEMAPWIEQYETFMTPVAEMLDEIDFDGLEEQRCDLLMGRLNRAESALASAPDADVDRFLRTALGEFTDAVGSCRKDDPRRWSSSLLAGKRATFGLQELLRDHYGADGLIALDLESEFGAERTLDSISGRYLAGEQ